MFIQIFYLSLHHNTNLKISKMRTFEIKTKRDEKKIPVERVFIDTGDTMFRLTLEIDGKLRINKIDKTEAFEHSINVNPATGNEILIS